jgi:hypothetical protein
MEDALVTIEPVFSSGEPLRFLSHECGPFDKRLQTNVPVWVALTLEHRHKCRIVPPAWLTVEYLEAKLREERVKTAAAFADIADESIQLASFLLSREGMPPGYLGGAETRKRLQGMVAEILMIRRGKITGGLKLIDVTTSVVDISGMTSHERAAIRRQTSVMMDSLRSLWTIRETVLAGEPRGM